VSSQNRPRSPEHPRGLRQACKTCEDPGGCIASTRELPRSLQDLLQHRVVVELGRQRTADLQPATKPALINLDARGGLTLDRVHHAGD
jgi:hypothetical protein